MSLRATAPADKRCGAFAAAAKYLCRNFVVVTGFCAFAAISSIQAQQLRVLGIDVSAYQGNLSAANWTTLKTDNTRDFVFIRASRGGTTGEDHRQGGYPSGNNTFYNLSERYDDPYYVQNINRATAAGLFAGTYHFARPDVIASTLNSDGVTTAGVDNTGTDEADHLIQMAGPWMRPGFLPPVLDLEAGDGIRTDNQMAQFCKDFSDEIYAVMGIRPAIYLNGNYAANILQTATTPTPAQIVAAFPYLWSARWPNQADPNSIDVQNAQPKDSYAPIYGPWDDSPNPTHPWKFWQYASTARLSGYANGGANIDVDVAQGGMEFLKDQLIPALWVTNTDGQWTTLANWNSGLTPVAPVSAPGQLTPIGTQTLPTPRLPAGNDTVILDRPTSAVVVTLSSGTQNIRKLYMRETLNITGGSLTINYVPSWDSTTNAAQFSGPVTMSGSASLSVHTLQVDSGQTFAVNGGTLAFNTINLMPNASPGKLALGGDVTLNSVGGTTATITNGTGAGSAGFVDLLAGTRALGVASGADISVSVLVSNGGITKTGPGTLRLRNANTYSGGTTVSAGTLLVNNTSGSGTGSGSVSVNGGILGGTGSISGALALGNSGTLAPGIGTNIGTLTLGSAPALSGTNVVKINRNAGAFLSDKLVLTIGTLNYGGTLVISNIGAALQGGDVFTNFVAPAFSGAFAATKLPPLGTNLNWYLGDLTTSGRIKVNRSPVTSPLSLTNSPMAQLQIPLATLLANATDADGDPLSLAGINLTSTNGVTLITNATTVFYSSSNNAADRIDYTISDGHGGTVNSVVLIIPSTTGQFLTLPNVSGNSAALSFAGAPGKVYYIERSTNLPVWMTIFTNTMPPTGLLQYTDDFHDLAAAPTSAFYRLAWSP